MKRMSSRVEMVRSLGSFGANKEARADTSPSYDGYPPSPVDVGDKGIEMQAASSKLGTPPVSPLRAGEVANPLRASIFTL